jgi:hypothetical protein
MLRMQEMTFQKFSGGVLPQKTSPFMRGILATHVAFCHCYPPLIYYLTEGSLFKKCPPTGKSLKKALFRGYRPLNYLHAVPESQAPMHNGQFGKRSNSIAVFRAQEAGTQEQSVV